MYVLFIINILCSKLGLNAPPLQEKHGDEWPKDPLFVENADPQIVTKNTPIFVKLKTDLTSHVTRSRDDHAMTITLLI